MEIKLNMESEDFEQLEANIVAKYAGISQKAAPKKAAKIDDQIQGFASNFSSAYKKFTELFFITHYLHGLYLAFAHVEPSDLDFLAVEEDLIKSYNELVALDRTLWIHPNIINFRRVSSELAEVTKR